MSNVAATRPATRATTIFVLAALLLGVSAGPVDAATVTVHIRETLSPKTLTVRPGTTVRWVNESTNRYRMRSRSGPVEFDSGNLEPGEAFTFTFTTPGTYPYLDDRERDDTDFHGTIVVAPAAPAASDEAATPAPGQPAAGQLALPTAATVRMAGRAFSPGSVTIAAGATVTFVNDDDREHSATATGRSFDTGVLNPGSTSRKAFPTPGTFAFLCVIHPEMRGTIIVRGVAAAPAATPTPTPTPPPTATPPPPFTPEPTSASSAAVIAIADFAFRPGSVEVAVGTTVTWRNGGESPHTVTAGDGSFDSGLIGPAGTFSQRFDAPGDFAFVCTFHPEMTGVVRVLQAETSVASPPARTTGAGSGPSSGRGDGPVAPATDAAPAAATDPGGLLRVLLVLGLLGGSVLTFGLLIAGVARPREERQPGG